MSRSSNIYMIIEKRELGKHSSILGCFTVKYEAEKAANTFLGNYRETYELVRFKDGGLDKGRVIPWNEK